MGFEDLEPIFGTPKAEWSASVSTPLRQYLFHLHALDSSRLRIHVTDFNSSTWEVVRSVSQLEDLRDNIGIGGSWSEFLDYVIASIKSEDTKLVLEGQSESGPAYAKLVAQKSKGMPRISLPLTKLVGTAASDAIANFSLELYKAFNGTNKLLINEQERSCQLTRVISAEQEKNENIQRQLDTIMCSKRQKSQMMTDKVTSDFSSVTNPPAANNQVGPNPKASNRVVPAYRRAKVRGVLLQDTEDDIDN